MRFTWWIASLWPGWWHVWHLGRWRGLALATAFAVSVNAALVTTFVWPQWPSGGLSPTASAAISWLLVLGLWSAGTVWLRRDLPRLAGATDAGKRQEWDVQFQQAQHEYLKGHWIEAESLLTQLLAENPRDVEARLLLAAVQRRTGRWIEALQMLRELKDDETAGRWHIEIETELVRRGELEGDSTVRPDDEGDNDELQSRAA